MIFTQTATDRQPTFIPDDIKPRILCFGDSLTWGDDPAQVGHRLPHRWPVSLQDSLGPGYTAIEEGQCGRNISTDDPPKGEKNGLRYILPCLESHAEMNDPFITIYLHGLMRQDAMNSIYLE